MITSLRLVDFKNFADETFRVGPFTVLVGTNASGKSNIRDAFRFLHGIGRGYTLAEIIGGRYGAGGQVEWQPIRGAANEIIRFGRPGFALELKLTLGNRDASYSIEVNRERFRTTEFGINYECLRIGQELIYERPKTAPEDKYIILNTGRNTHIRRDRSRDRPALTQLYESIRVAVRFNPDYSWNMLIRASNSAFSCSRSPVSVEALSIRLNRLENRTIEPVINRFPARGTVTRRQVDFPARNPHRFGPFHGPDSSSRPLSRRPGHPRQSLPQPLPVRRPLTDDENQSPPLT